MRTPFFIITLSIFSILFSSCGSDKGKDLPEIDTSRTVLVYMVANNNLLAFASDDIREMKEAAPELPADARWLIYIDEGKNQPTLRELTRDGKWNILKTYTDNSLSVSLDRIKEVFSDTRTLAPAKNYGLILWSHASGWLQDGIAEPSLSTLSFGDDGGKRCNITTLRAAIEPYKMEFIYGDCCNLSSVEVAYELRKCAGLFASSATRMPADGMPYDRTLPCLAKGEIVEAAKATMKYYTEKMSTYPWCALSVIDLSVMDRLASETRAVYQKSGYPVNYVPVPHEKGDNCFCFDMKHFIDALAPGETAEWNKTLSDAVIYEDHLEYLAETKIPLKAHCGLSTFILSNSSSAGYKGYSQLEWYENVSRFQPLNN